MITLLIIFGSGNMVAMPEAYTDMAACVREAKKIIPATGWKEGATRFACVPSIIISKEENLEWKN